MARLDKKVVFITGGASGVGRECAAQVVREGGQVVIADLDEDRGAAAVAELGVANAMFQRLDVSSEDDWKRCIQASLAHFGRLNGLVHAAAICLPPNIEETTMDLWQRVMRVNADGAFLASRSAVAVMREHGGSIVNLVSTAAVVGHQGMCAYSASKGAVLALTRNVAAHCRAQGLFIRANAVIPGGIKTPMVEHIWRSLDPAYTDITVSPTAGFCDPIDVAYAVIYLLSDESRFVNGAEMRVDNALLSAIA